MPGAVPKGRFHLISASLLCFFVVKEELYSLFFERWTFLCVTGVAGNGYSSVTDVQSTCLGVGSRFGPTMYQQTGAFTS